MAWTSSTEERSCDVIIPIWNQQARTQRCLESILESGGSGIRLILIDNGSEAPTQRFLDRFQKEAPLPVKIVRNASNLGFIKAANQGIRASGSAWICLLNNDTLVTPGWLTEMIQVAEGSPRIGLVNPTSNSLGFRAPESSPLEAYARQLKAESGKWAELTTALGFCLLARRSLFNRVGLLDERFGMGNFDDDDLSRRVRNAGLLCVRACGAYVYHEEKVSFRELPGWEKAFEENRRQFEQIWGKPLRILWAGPFPRERESSWSEAALELARQGHWICFATPPGTVPAELAGRAQVSQMGCSGKNWRIKALIRLLLKRKKPFRLVIHGDPSWTRWVRLFRFLHPAAVLTNPTREEIFEECQTLSHSR